MARLRALVPPRAAILLAIHAWIRTWARGVAARVAVILAAVRARTLIPAGASLPTARRPASRFPFRPARRMPKTQRRAPGGPGTPSQGSASGRMPVPGRIRALAAGPGWGRMLGPAGGGRPVSARAPMPGSGRGPGRITHPERAAGPSPTVPRCWTTCAAPGEPRHPQRLRGHRDRSGPAPSPIRGTGPGSMRDPVRREPPGRDGGARPRARTRFTPGRRPPCRTRPSVTHVAATAQVPARTAAGSRMR
jgi:hypothetical protein